MEIETRITEVIVFPDRARLVRRGRVYLEPGTHRLEVPDLSNRLGPDSARVSAYGTAQARLLAMQLQQAFFVETPAEQVRQLEAQVEAVQDEISAFNARLALNEQSLAHLDSLAGHTKVYARALADGRQNAEDQLALFERLSRRAAELNDEKLAIEQSRRQSESRLAQLEQQLEQVRSQRPRNRFTALIDLDVTKAGDLEIELSYLVTGASWTPMYDLRLTEGSENGFGKKPLLEVGYLAQVTQNSGESWQEVALTLSTARPALAASVPELKPWFVQPAPPPRPIPAPAPAAKMQRLHMAEPSDAGAELNMAMAEDAAPVEEAVARIEAGGAAVSYSIPGRATIPPDGSAFKAVIARYSLSPDLSYVSAPALVPAAYRRVKARNESPYTLLPGRANLFAGDEFLGAARLELTAPNGEIEVYLGIDDRIHVERKLVRREVDKTMISGRRRLHYGYETQVENLLTTPIVVLVRDQFPVGRHEEIKTRLESAEPRLARQNELNQIEWELPLAPKESRLLRFDFLVEFPQGMEVFGLP